MSTHEAWRVRPAQPLHGKFQGSPNRYLVLKLEADVVIITFDLLGKLGKAATALPLPVTLRSHPSHIAMVNSDQRNVSFLNNKS